MKLEHERSLWKRVSIPPRALVVTQVSGNFKFLGPTGRTRTHPGCAQVFLALECLNSLTRSEVVSLKTLIVEILDTDICKDWCNKRGRLTELLHPHELQHNREVTTILELALWKEEIYQLVCCTRTARKACLRMCGSEIVIPKVMSFF